MFKLICASCRLAAGLAERLPAGGEPGNKSESVGALLQAVRHEEAKVHIDLPTLMKVSVLVSPLSPCMHLPLFMGGHQFGCDEFKVFSAHKTHGQACQLNGESKKTRGVCICVHGRLDCVSACICR